MTKFMLGRCSLHVADWTIACCKFAVPVGGGFRAADACAAMSCAPSSRPAALWGSSRSRSGTSICDLIPVSATRSAVMPMLHGSDRR